MVDPNTPLGSHLEIAAASVRVFANDGTLDMRELDHLLSVALRDGSVNEDERRVLGNVLGRLNEHEVTPAVWKRIREVREQYGI